jgi:hypothetical protein
MLACEFVRSKCRPRLRISSYGRCGYTKRSADLGPRRRSMLRAVRRIFLCVCDLQHTTPPRIELHFEALNGPNITNTDAGDLAETFFERRIRSSHDK